MNTSSENLETDLVRVIFSLTDEQRRSPHLQTFCQFIYCKFVTNEFDETSPSCHVSSERLFLSAEHPSQVHFLRTRFINLIRIYIYPIFIVLGILGNSLSCLIMFLNIRRNGYTANLYLTLLAFVDCLFILGSALPEWLWNLDSTFDFRQRSQFFCRFIYWFGNFMTHLSAGLVISVTIERFIAIKYPLISHKIHTVKHTHMLLVTLTIFLFLLDSRLFFLLNHIHESIHFVTTCSNNTNVKYRHYEITECSIENYQHEQIWLIIDFSVYTLFPFLIIVTLNSLIIHRLIIAQRKRQRMSHVLSLSIESEKKTLSRNHSDKPVIENDYTFSYLRRCQSVPERAPSAVMLRPPFNYSHHPRSSFRQSNSSNDSTNRARNSSMRQRKNSSNTRLTILLLFISGTFLALTLPAVVLNLIVSIQLTPNGTTFDISIDTSRRDQQLTAKTYYTICRLLMIVNHSTNFLLYLVVGKRFRRDLKLICLGHWRQFCRQ